MKVIITITFLLIFQTTLFCQTGSFEVNNTQFVTVTETKPNEVGTRDTLLKLYRIENGKRKYLLTHYLFSKTVDCDNVFTDLGTMYVVHDSIISIKRYLQTKKIKDPIPDLRKQIFVVTELGKLKLAFDKVRKRNSEWLNTSFNDDHKGYPLR